MSRYPTSYQRRTAAVTASTTTQANQPEPGRVRRRRGASWLGASVASAALTTTGQRVQVVAVVGVGGADGPRRLPVRVAGVVGDEVDGPVLAVGVDAADVLA